MPQGDKELEAALAALTPQERAQLEKIISSGALEFGDVESGASTSAPPAPPSFADVSGGESSTAQAPPSFSDTYGQMVQGESEGLPAAAKGSLAALGLIGSVAAPVAAGEVAAATLPGVSWAVPTAIGGAVGLTELARGRSPWWAAAEGGMAGAGARWIPTVIERFKAARMAKRELAALNRIGPTAEAAARNEAILARGESVGARQPIRVQAEPGGIRNRPSVPASVEPAPELTDAERIELARRELEAMRVAPPGARQRFAASSEPGGIRNRPYPSQAMPAEAPEIAAAPPAVAAEPPSPPSSPPTKPPKSRLGNPQTGSASSRTQTTAQAANIGSQARAAINSVHARLAAGETAEAIVKSFVGMGIRPDVAKVLVQAAKGTATVIPFAAAERNRKAQRALQEQAQGVVP